MRKIFLTTIFCANLFASQLDLTGTVTSDNEKIITLIIVFLQFQFCSTANYPNQIS